MDRIVCLVGESGSGKTTIAEELEKKGYNYIQSYTTRPQRYEGEKGHIFVDCLPKEHFYVIDCIDNEVFPSNNVIAYTEIKKHHYWALKSQYKNKGISIYVIDPRGIKDLRDRLWNDNIEGEVDILGIYLKADEKIRLDRVSKEYESEKAAERLARDKGKFDVIDCNYVVDANRDISEVLKDVIEIIEQ